VRRLHDPTQVPAAESTRQDPPTEKRAAVEPGWLIVTMRRKFLDTGGTSWALGNSDAFFVAADGTLLRQPYG
jgi:hypothetical protein